MNFADQLFNAVRSRGNALCVGLDPRWEQLPDDFRDEFNPGKSEDQAAAYEVFGRMVIDLVAEVVPVVKPQSAFFEALGPAGIEALASVVEYARARNLMVVLDAKRGDIGSTAQAYAEAYLGPGPAGIPSNALTVNPYMGMDTIEPFLETAEQNDGGVFVLVKTSNPGSGQFQDVRSATTGATIFEEVADQVELLSESRQGESGYGPVGAVVGATYPKQLADLRARMPHVPLLIPGFGAQGGGVDDVKPGFDSQGMGAIVNSSRGIIFGFSKEEHLGKPWQEGVLAECQKAAELLSVSNLAQ